MHPIDNLRVKRTKASFVTRRVDPDDIAWLDSEAEDLSAGDLVVARVTEIGQHGRLERPDGRRAHLFCGDEILVACGARYAPDQFEACAPKSVGDAHLVAAGGIAGLVRHSHAQMKPATGLTILGAACDRNRQRMNLARYGVSAAVRPSRVPVLGVCGTSMNAGKTFTAASLVHGLTAAGRKVAAIKATGTGGGGDLWMFRDAGAWLTRDFTDAGFATTYGVAADELFAGLLQLVSEAEAAGAEAIVLEVADGLRQTETAELLRRDRFRDLLDSVIFAAGDAMGAEAGVDWLQCAGYAPRALAGRLTQSPLAMREAAATIALPCLTAAELRTPEIAVRLAKISPPPELRTAA